MNNLLTVCDLIKLLSDYDPELYIFVDGYEYGVGRITPESVKKITAVNCNTNETIIGVNITRLCDSPDEDEYGMIFEIPECVGGENSDDEHGKETKKCEGFSYRTRSKMSIYKRFWIGMLGIGMVLADVLLNFPKPIGFLVGLLGGSVVGWQIAAWDRK